MQPDARLPSEMVVKATGDTVGNNGAVAIRHNDDGSTTLRVANARSEMGIFLTPAQTVKLAAALLTKHAPTGSAPEWPVT